ncbi:MAG: hypothetical protein LBS27_03220 [Bifidobacteriaceae bacterium]|jgi:predicted metal-dependent HD superfamily phosphohydrolase|nr:hypothetical protein [Bifidobacteriaceae bacterium]
MNLAEAPDWLLAVWSRALAEAGSAAPPNEVSRMGAKLLERWANPARTFHGINHLITVLEKADELAQEASCPSLVRLSAFYHGAVLSNARGPGEQHAWGEDEAASAVLAEGQLRHLELPEAKAVRVANLIVQLGARPPQIKDPDLAVLCDAERAVLASDPKSYRRYAEAVRAECGDEPLQTILTARIAVLRHWLAQDRLFLTSGTAAWEDAARNNIEAELARTTRDLAAMESPALHPSAGGALRPAVVGRVGGSFAAGGRLTVV